MSDLLKKRMASTKQASELAASDAAYEQIFRESPPKAQVATRDLPIDMLDPFSTADIGFKPYSRQRLEAFAEQLKEEGLLVRILVRPKADGRYEILAGHNRTSAARLAGWETIPAEIVEADDARAIVIATSTNLIQRQQLSIVERGKAYKALLSAKSRQGLRTDLLPLTTSVDFRLKSSDLLGDTTSVDSRPKSSGTPGDTTSVDSRPKSNDTPSDTTSVGSRPKYSARALVAEFFGVTEYEIRKLIKLTNLDPRLLEVLEDGTKLLNLASADMIADYDAATQRVFAELCVDYGKQINKAAMQYVIHQCPPPTADRQAIFKAWREAEAKSEQKKLAPPNNITFSRKAFAPYLEKLGSEAKLEEMFLAFLRERVGG